MKHLASRVASLLLLLAATATTRVLAQYADLAAAPRAGKLMARQERAVERRTPGKKPVPTAATLEVEALPSADAMLVRFTLPPAEGIARLELTDVLTGQVLYAGQINGPGGSVTLPLQNPAGDYEARLITSQDAIARRLRP